MQNQLKAPFPYYGGKSRLAPVVWQAFGELDRYLEPFFGSGAVLLNAPKPAKYEIVCDLSPHVSNFWRAVKADPEAVAHHAGYPTLHLDLHARHDWLVRWGEGKLNKLQTNPNYYNAKAAGWWAWGMSIWTGSGFAMHGESAKGSATPHGTLTQKPHIVDQGVRKVDETRLRAWLQWLCERMCKVVVLPRSWESGVTDSMTLASERGKARVGVFLDPPYKTEHRSKTLYVTDREGLSTDIAVAAYEWAVAKARERPEIRIGYCCRHGDFPLPAGWRLSSLRVGVCQCAAFRP